MTDERDSGASGGPDGSDVPVDVAALAELDAGLPGSAEPARSWAAASADPRAAAVLDALAATRAELAGLPTPEVPPAAAARWTAALAAESDRDMATRRRSQTPANRDEVTCGRSQTRPPSRGRVLAAAVAAAVVVVGAGVTALVHRPAPPAPTVTRVELVALGRAAVGTMDLGDLADPARRAACLRAVAPAATGEVLLGGRRVVLDGSPGVLLVLATGPTGGLRLLTVDPGCGPRGGTVRAQLVVT